jgi:hypothetical protein
MPPSSEKSGTRRSASLKIAAACAFACISPASPCHAAVTVQFQQVGNDLVVTSTGDLDLTGLSWSWSAWEMEDAYYRQIGGDLPQDLVRLFRDSVSSFEFPMGGNFFSKGLPVRVADGYSGMTFGLWANASMFALYVPRNFRSGPISSSMTFYNLDLASVGVIEQVIQLGASNGLRINITVVPEPGTLAMPAVVVTGMALRRKRRPRAQAV